MSQARFTHLILPGSGMQSLRRWRLLRLLDVGEWLWHAGQQRLRQIVDVIKQRLLRPRNAEHVFSRLGQGRGYAFLRPNLC